MKQPLDPELERIKAHLQPDPDPPVTDDDEEIETEETDPEPLADNPAPDTGDIPPVAAPDPDPDPEPESEQPEPVADIPAPVAPPGPAPEHGKRGRVPKENDPVQTQVSDIKKKRRSRQSPEDGKQSKSTGRSALDLFFRR